MDESPRTRANPWADHNVFIDADQAAKLREWLKTPNGSCVLGRQLTVEAVEGGGLKIRTRKWTGAKTR
jgi:hypothetical protein